MSDRPGKPGIHSSSVTRPESERSEPRRRQLPQDPGLERERLHALINSLPDDVFFVDATGQVVLVNDAVRSSLGVSGAEDLHTRLAEVEAMFEVYTPEGRRRRPEESPFLRALEGETVQGEEIVRNVKTGELRRREYRLAPVYLEGKRVGAVSTVRDITEQKRADREAALTAEDLARDVTALMRMHDLSRRFVEAAGMQPLLQDIMDAAVEFMRAQKGTLQLVEGDTLRIVADHGHKPPFLEFFASAEEQVSACGEALKHCERIIVPDVETSPLFAGTRSLAVLREAGVRAVQSTPVVSRTGMLLGVLTTHWDAPHTPDERDLWRLDLLARQAADLIDGKRMDQLLVAERDKARQLLDIAGVMILSLDTRGRVTLINRKGCEILGCPAEAVIGKDWVEAFLPADRRVDMKLAFQKLVTGDVHEVEVLESPVITAERRLRQIAWHNTVIRDKEGRIVGTLSSGEDVTERKRAEAALQGSEERLRLAQVAGNVGVWDWDLSTGEIGFAPEFERLYGLEPGRMRTYEDWRRRVHPDDIARGEQVRDAAIAAHRPFEVEFRILHPSGDVRWLLSRGGALYDGNGDVMRVLGVNVDITERKLMEERVSYLASFPESDPNPIVEVTAEGEVAYANPAALALFPEIRGRGDAHPWLAGWRSMAAAIAQEGAPGRRVVSVGDRSYQQELTPQGGVLRVYGVDITQLATTEEALRSANQQLRDADRRKDEFLATLSHELRNPLAPITNGLYILDRAVPGGEEAQNAQRIIDRQVRQLTRIVDDLLDVTRIARGKILLQRERLELNDLVGRTIEDHRAIFQTGDVVLEYEPSPAPVYVDGDWNRLGQSLGNLLQNAVKFTGEGGRVRVAVSSDPATRRAELRVTDTGIGMTEQTMSRLFEPFMQADMTLDRSRGGLGLGLALVKGIVELHGGEIAAHSAGLGQGAEFVIRLPLDLTRPTRREAKPGPLISRRRRVLIIEDSPDAASSLRMLLGSCGHDVEVAYDGRHGLEKAREFLPEVLLCDIGLPGMDGYEVARVFRGDEALRDTFLVALSGYALPEDLQRAADAGFDQHMAKPPDLERLLDLLSGPTRRSS